MKGAKTCFTAANLKYGKVGSRQCNECIQGSRSSWWNTVWRQLMPAFCEGIASPQYRFDHSKQLHLIVKWAVGENPLADKTIINEVKPGMWCPLHKAFTPYENFGPKVLGGPPSEAM